MGIAYTLILILLAAASILLAAMRPHRSVMSGFELKRRARDGDQKAQLDVHREKAYLDLVSLQRILAAVLLVVFTATAIAASDLWTGLGLALLLAILGGAMGRVKPVQRFSERLFNEHERRLLAFVERYRPYVWWIRLPAVERVGNGLHSKEELTHLIETTHVIADDSQRSLLLNALSFDERRIDEVMTARKYLKTVKRTEILGPLVLDDLHRSGHQSFPVISGDVDHIVGILRLTDVQTLDTNRKHTALAETAMRHTVLYVASDTPLKQALLLLLDSHEHVLIVADESSQVVGLVTLSDIIRALFGK